MLANNLPSFRTATPIFHLFFHSPHSLSPLPPVRQNPSPLCDTQKKERILLSSFRSLLLSPSSLLPPPFTRLRSFFSQFLRLVSPVIYIRSIRLFPTDTAPVLRSLFSHGRSGNRSKAHRTRGCK